MPDRPAARGPAEGGVIGEGEHRHLRPPRRRRHCPCLRHGRVKRPRRSARAPAAIASRAACAAPDAAAAGIEGPGSTPARPQVRADRQGGTGSSQRRLSQRDVGAGPAAAAARPPRGASGGSAGPRGGGVVATHRAGGGTVTCRRAGGQRHERQRQGPGPVSSEPTSDLLLRCPSRPAGRADVPWSATPIGNLGDLPPRALAALKEAGAVHLQEDSEEVRDGAAIPPVSVSVFRAGRVATIPAGPRRCPAR